MTCATLDFETWAHGSEAVALGLVYTWLIKQVNHQYRLAKLSNCFAIEGVSSEDRVQEALIAVCKASLKRRNGSIKDRDALKAYLLVGTIKKIRYQWVDWCRVTNNPSILMCLRGKATSPVALLRIARLRVAIANLLHEKHPQLSRYEATEALLEGEVALSMCYLTTSDTLHERLISFMEEVVHQFRLAPDAEKAQELLMGSRTSPYMMWRLEMGQQETSRVFHTLRRRVKKHLMLGRLGLELAHALQDVGRAPGVIPCLPYRDL